MSISRSAKPRMSRKPMIEKMISLMPSPRLLMIASLALLLASSASFAQFAPEQSAPKPTFDPTLGDKTASDIEKLDADNLAKFKGNDDVMVRPGLLANRKEKWVRLYGRATGVGQHD